jgi:hypothetical protein
MFSSNLLTKITKKSYFDEAIKNALKRNKKKKEKKKKKGVK